MLQVLKLDSLLFQKVLHHLIGNAIKFTEEGSVNIILTPIKTPKRVSDQIQIQYRLIRIAWVLVLQTPFQ